MAKRSRPTEQDAAEVKRILLAGLANGDEVPAIAQSLATRHPKNDTFPGEVLLGLGADALDVIGVSRAEPLAYEGVRERFLGECDFRGKENRKLQYCLLSIGALHGGIELDLLDEVGWWNDDFWYYALCASVAWMRAAAAHADLPVPALCQRVADRHGLELEA